ncbi:HYC_CC_PP family protein [Sporocytophaga myxococcoides]|uniref:HYC_CC_PP family protein n=1 Tax=Sporocytophaga myxococcoides TaxID=153721 RepID=UPI0005EF43EF|nr:hypothetical protein [Sporocytophaga myxococcoides]
MKRIAIISVLMLYTVFTTGLSVYTHYCAGKLASISFFGPDKKGCGKCAVKITKDCCKDKQYNFSLDDSQIHHKSNFVITDYSNIIAILPSYDYGVQPQFSLINSYSVKLYSYKNGPPKTPIYIQNRSIII